MDRHLAAVAIPLYYTNLTSFDRVSILRCFELWGDKLDIYFVKPESLDISSVQHEFKQSQIISFNDSFFSDIKGYNRLMLSPIFYEKFLSYEYIFVYQTDGYAFRDELEQWCMKGYDYIGAPWIPSPKRFPLADKAFVIARRFINRLLGVPDRSEMYFQVGNGGVSLRKSSIFHQRAITDADNIGKYISNLGKSPMYNEDVYWNNAPKSGGKCSLSKPGYKEALGFSFDMNPSECYRLNNYKLPFCCHGFSKPRFQPFWKQFIN